MTAEEERRLRHWARTARPLMGFEDTALRWAVAEIDRLRRLPVIPACGECASYEDERCGLSRRETSRNAVPPEWCPHRGGPSHG